jgi:hypothetical protein
MKMADFDQPAAILATDSMSMDDAQVDLGNECSTRSKTARKHDTKSKTCKPHKTSAHREVWPPADRRLKGWPRSMLNSNQSGQPYVIGSARVFFRPEFSSNAHFRASFPC